MLKEAPKGAVDGEEWGKESMGGAESKQASHGRESKGEARRMETDGLSAREANAGGIVR